MWIMARALRVEYEGATYHVMCRGNRGAQIFSTQNDIDLWLRTLGEACERSQLLVHAYCVMSSHYHLLLETPKGNLVEGMKWMQATFTQRYNAVHQQRGHLFQGRYKAKVVDTDPEYFRSVGLYILLNPVDAGVLDLQEQRLKAYPWSSYPLMVGSPSKRPAWLIADRLLSSCGIAADSIAGRRAFAAYLKERGLSLQLKNMSKQDRWDWRAMERGWVHGRSDFREAMIALLEEHGQTSHVEAGAQKRDISQSKALRALEQGLQVLGLSRSELEQLKKGDERKLILGGWLRVHYPVSTKWCSEQLCMGHISTNTRAWNFYRNPPVRWKSEKKKLDKIIELFG